MCYEKLCITLIFFSLLHITKGQEITGVLSEEDNNVEILIEQLDLLLETPIEINIATEEELLASGIFTMFRTKALLDYRRRFGTIYSIYELQSVFGFDKEFIETYGKYISVKAKKAPTKYKQSLWNNSRILITHSDIIQKLEGEKDSSYLGSSNNLYVKFIRANKHGVGYGFLCEKDRGELLRINDSIHGFDHYSAYISYINDNSIFVIGSFSAKFGLGLNINNGYSVSKSFRTTSLANNNYGIKPHISKFESNILNGVAIEKKISENFKISTFYSNTAFDIVYTGNNDSILNIRTTGDHSTESLLTTKNSGRVHGTGLYAQFKSPYLHIGMGSSYFGFEYPFSVQDALYKYFEDSVSYFFNNSIDFRYSCFPLIIYGEFSFDRNFDPAFITACDIFLSEQIDISFLYRNYSPKYNAFMSNAFKEGPHVQNEQGLYFGIEYNISSDLKFHLSYDYFYFPWLQYTTNAPGNGFEFNSGLNYSFDVHTLSFSIKYEEKSISSTSETEIIKSNTLKTRKYMKCILRSNLSTRLVIQNSLILGQYRTDEPENGFLFYTDCMYKHDERQNFKFRLSIFDATYNARLYAYEHDVYQTFSVLSYFYNGMKLSYLHSFLLKEKCKLQCKIAHYHYFDRDSIGSGNSTIEGSNKTEYRLLFTYKI